MNLDMAKATYCWLVARDKAIEGTVVRSSTIPEELGRISYLLSDKTGTLTKNEMSFKKVHLGSVAFGQDTFDEVPFLFLSYCPLHPAPLSPRSRTI